MSDRGGNATNIHSTSYSDMRINSDTLLQNVELDGDELSGIVTQQDILLLAQNKQSSICS